MTKIIGKYRGNEYESESDFNKCYKTLEIYRSDCCLSYPQKELNALISCLDELLDKIGDNEDHPLIGLADYISYIISAYEDEYYSAPMGKGIDALKFLMESQQLQQSDLSIIGSQGVVSEILNGKRQLNLRQIKLLANYFKVTPATFID